MVIEGELDHAMNSLHRLEFGQIELALGVANRAVEFFQHFDVQLFLAAEIVIDHPFRGFGAFGNGIDARTRQAMGDKLGNGGLQNVFAGFFRIVLAPFRCNGNGFVSSFHCWLMPTSDARSMQPTGN